MQLGNGSTITNSRIIGNVVIGERTHISNSTINSCSIGDDISITHSSIVDSIVLSRTKMDGMGVVHESIIGRDAFLKGHRQESRLQFMIGDHGRVML